MLDFWLDHNPPQSIETADEVTHRVGEKVVAIGNSGFKVDFEGEGKAVLIVSKT